MTPPNFNLPDGCSVEDVEGREDDDETFSLYTDGNDEPREDFDL
jgi:hypothetical protein